MLALRWASTSRSAGEPGRGHIRGSAWAPQISAARCGSGATAAVVTKLIILELRIPAGLDERFEFSGQIPEASGADNGLSRDLHGPSGRGTAWRSPPGGLQPHVTNTEHEVVINLMAVSGKRLGLQCRGVSLTHSAR